VGRRKSHHTHEVTDAYAEGWDARLAQAPNVLLPANPYDSLPPLPTRKQSEERSAARSRDADLWRDGWADCELDLTRRDLDEVGAADFRRAPTVGVEPIDSEGEEVDASED
jgi:hypothetical protein